MADSKFKTWVTSSLAGLAFASPTPAIAENTPPNLSNTVSNVQAATPDTLRPSLRQTMIENQQMEQEPWRKEILKQAEILHKENIGYQWGAKPETSKSSLDCSGFTRTVLQNVSHTNLMKLFGQGTSQQINQNKISESELRPGDLAFIMGPDGKPNHVAFYKGNGIFIHDSQSQGGVAETGKKFTAKENGKDQEVEFTEFRRLTPEIQKALLAGMIKDGILKDSIIAQTKYSSTITPMQARR